MGVLILLGLALLSGALSMLVLLPAAQHLRSFQDGEQTPATLHTEGSCMLGRCQVEFKTGGRTVVADLPAGSTGGRQSAGSQMTVRYHADDPQTAVREEDLRGGGPVILAVLSGGTALLFALMSVVGMIHVLRQRQTVPST
ncbi:DUF3592 domain-containing protein [Streptomyces sp. NPDC050658]|uniref:DUF3592 domain-containing protein n=1 Tax=unclassified Streptomyces TaxID=2593676 RepID=UPI0034151615